MGGKRPDQHNIDPSEGQSTDHKWGPGNTDEDIKNQDKEKYAATKHRDRTSMIPESGTNPALAELRAVKADSLIPEAGVNPAMEELRAVKSDARDDDAPRGGKTKRS